jgi:8-oxo-dGTP pyrophosphatase MutT (NUDIX family)
MKPIKKAYGYITRVKEEQLQVLVFLHKGIPEAGIQIPKGTVEVNESTYNAVMREVKEETGLETFDVKNLIAEDHWENDDGAVHNRYFYKIVCHDERDQWEHQPTGGGEETGHTFQFFWIASIGEVDLVRGHADYLNVVLKGCEVSC